MRVVGALKPHKRTPGTTLLSVQCQNSEPLVQAFLLTQAASHTKKVRVISKVDSSSCSS